MGESQCGGIAVLGNRSVEELRCRKVAVWGSCSVEELQCGGVAVCKWKCLFYCLLEVRKIYKLKVGVVIFFEVWLNLDSRDHLRWYIE